MQQRDYLMRQIEQMSQALVALIRKLLGLKTEKNEEETEKATNELLQDQLNTSLRELLNVQPGEIAQFIVETKGLDVSNLDLFADVLVLNAKARSNGTDKEKLFRIALELYKWTDNKSKTFSMERQSKVREIQDHLKI